MATHPYSPLLLEDSSLLGQLRAGLASSERILGFRPKGIWLPENAYRPDGTWHPPINWGQPRDSAAASSTTSPKWASTTSSSRTTSSRTAIANGCATASGNASAGSSPSRTPTEAGTACRSPSGWTPPRQSPGTTAAFARDPWICKQVWSGKVGYPANGTYLEFHKKHGLRRGLRYWKVTDPAAGLGEKDPYYPDDVPRVIHEHGRHFCNEVKRRLWDHHNRTGRHGVVAACFDAELFGHWWFEGPRFLKEVLLTLNADPDVDVSTAGQFLHDHWPDKGVSLPEGSWGEGGDHRVWANDRISWMWEIEYRCETIFGKLTFNLPWRTNKKLRGILEKAGRELLLLQASDWPFVISRHQAVDYGIKRFMQHVSRFECLTDIAEKLAEDSDYLSRLSEVEKFEIKDAEVHDVIFPHIDLNWWST